MDKISVDLCDTDKIMTTRKKEKIVEIIEILHESPDRLEMECTACKAS